MEIYGTSVETSTYESAAAANGYFETTASPSALSTLSRRAILLRDIDEPIQFPYWDEEVGSTAI